MAALIHLLPNAGSVQRIFLISRPLLWINTIGPAFIGLWLSGVLWVGEFLPLLLWLTLPFNLLIYGVNDISDREVDAVSTRKGGLEGAKISKAEVRSIVTATACLNLPFAAYFFWRLPTAALFWVFLYIFVFLAYSVPPLRLKARPLLDALSNAAYAFPMVWVPLALGLPVHWTAALAMMSWCVAKQAFDAIQDRDDDARFGLQTTVVRFGIKRTLLWCAFWWSVSSLLFAQISQSVGLLNGLYAFVLLGTLALQPSVRRAHDLYKYSIAFPYLVGSFAGIGLALAVFLGEWAA